MYNSLLTAKNPWMCGGRAMFKKRRGHDRQQAREVCVCARARGAAAVASLAPETFSSIGRSPLSSLACLESVVQVEPEESRQR